MKQLEVRILNGQQPSTTVRQLCVWGSIVLRANHLSNNGPVKASKVGVATGTGRSAMKDLLRRITGAFELIFHNWREDGHTYSVECTPDNTIEFLTLAPRKEEINKQILNIIQKANAAISNVKNSWPNLLVVDISMSEGDSLVGVLFKLQVTVKE